MLRIKKILYPTDSSICAESAFAHALHLAERFGAELHILHAVVRHRQDPVNLGVSFPLNEEEISRQLHLDSHPLVEGREWDYQVPIIQAEVQDVSASVAILDYADKHDIDIVVMATHGRRGMDRLLMGSVAEEVVRLATCPVFIVRACPELAELKPALKRILVPVDFSESSGLSILYAGELARAYGATLDLLHVIEDAVMPHVYGIEPIAIDLPEIETQTRQALQDLVAAAGSVAVPVEAHVALGYAQSEIKDFADKHDTDLIVIATHGRTGMKRLFMGSVTEQVMRSVHCPVFTVKSFGKTLVPASAKTDSSPAA